VADLRQTKQYCNATKLLYHNKLIISVADCFMKFITSPRLMYSYVCLRRILYHELCREFDRLLINVQCFSFGCLMFGYMFDFYEFSLNTKWLGVVSTGTAMFCPSCDHVCDATPQQSALLSHPRTLKAAEVGLGYLAS
jgi:hypothetical protein